MDVYVPLSDAKRRSLVLAGLVLVIIIITVIVGYFSLAPRRAPQTQVVTIPTGITTTGAGRTLREHSVIKSALIYRILLLGKQVHAGDYEFTKPYTFFSVVRRTARGNFGKSQVRVTIPEGMTVRDIASEIKNQIPQFDAAQFILKAATFEGTLFPDTYYYFRSVTPDQVIERMRDGFDANIQPVLDNAKSNRSAQSIIIMASILEKEAANANEAKIIAGILWKRLEKGWPLQVDADMTTYQRQGLPDRAICNPGKAMIEAALSPTASDYWYYIHDKTGLVHFAKTLDEQQANIRKYLR